MKEITFDKFVEEFRPIKNTISFDSPYEEYMFKTYGEELEYIKLFKNEAVWTIIEDSGREWLIPGYHFVNRVGYMISREMWKDENIIVKL